jgi:Tat protein secretion system quality control protein TatD with DNase activity
LAGVERILVPGWDIASSERALDLVGRFPWLEAAVGVHPHDAAAVDDSAWARIVELAADPRVVAIGETGLDYDRMFSPIDAQLATSGATSPSPGDRQAGDRPCRSKTGARDAQDALLEERLGRHRWLPSDGLAAIIHLIRDLWTRRGGRPSGWR